MTEKIRTYSELITIPSFYERKKYLMLHGKVGSETFGFDRIFNQMFYHSNEWKAIRKYVIVRDNASDLGLIKIPDGMNIYIHHMNPISIEDIENATDYLMNPEYLITTIYDTHSFIHYGIEHDDSPTIRTLYDTCPWRK